VSLATTLAETGLEEKDPALYLFLRSLALAIDRLNVNFSLSYDQPTALQNQAAGAAGVDVAASVGPDVLVVNAIRFLGDKNGLNLDSSRTMGAGIYNGGPQVIATGFFQALQQPTGEVWDLDDMHDPVVNNERFTIQHAGQYIVGATVSFDGSAAGTYRQLALFKNGGEYLDLGFGPPSGVAGSPRVHVTSTHRFIQGDYVSLSVNHDAGVNMNVYTTAFWIQRVS
jgi:hypothetical protein